MAIRIFDILMLEKKYHLFISWIHRIDSITTVHRITQSINIIQLYIFQKNSMRIVLANAFVIIAIIKISYIDSL